MQRIESRSAVSRDYEAAAARAALVYVNDEEPGVRRLKRGKGFSYVTPDGESLRDAETLARIRSLAIPPAWRDVWISPDPDGHIQATGRDAKGRKQYRYHTGWTACRDEAKFSSLAAFARALPDLRDQVERDLARRDLSRERVLGSLVALLDETMIRIGNDIYAKQNRSFGLTTLRRQHVDVAGATLRFAFRGKSGQEWRLKLANQRIAKSIRALHDLPGQRLFKYVDEDGILRPVHSHDVNGYIQEIIGPEFSSKHFRTWGATNAAAHVFGSTPLPETKRERTRILNDVFDRVARLLNNTRSVCRRCYVHPHVPEHWLQGALQEELTAIRRRFRRPLKGLDLEESTLLRWLEGLQA